MSRHYRDSKDIPNDVLAARLKELSDYCTKNDMPSEFSMRIPCELDRDADVVLGEASRRLSSLAVPVTEGVWEALQGLVDAVIPEVNEKGAGGYLLARLSDARAALATRGAGPTVAKGWPDEYRKESEAHMFEYGKLIVKHHDALHHIRRLIFHMGTEANRPAWESDFAAASRFIAGVPAAPPLPDSPWRPEYIDPDTEKPPSKFKVLAKVEFKPGKFYYTTAQYIAPKTVLSEDFLNEDCDLGDLDEYDDEKDCYWVKEAWFEEQWEPETQYQISDKVVGWMLIPGKPLPVAPEIQKG